MEDPSVSVARLLGEAVTADRYGFEKAVSSWEAVAEDPSIDAVSIVVGNALHRPIAEALVAAGKHVLCEKPLASSMEDARAMAALEKDANVVTAVGYTYRRNHTPDPPPASPLPSRVKESPAMKLGLYNAILHDRSLPEAIKVIDDVGLTGIEINTGGFLPAVHVPTFDDILVSDTARDDFLGIFEGTGVSIAGLNANGNPLHPNPAIGEKHAEDIRRSIRLAERLGQHRVVTMSGLPGGEPGTVRPNWIVNAWNSAALDVLDYQWKILADFWRETDRLARDHDVKVALELHPQNVVFNSASVHQLIDLTGATNIGVELDASHLFWQQMDPVLVVRHLGELVFHAAAKDVRINRQHAALNGVLDNSFRRLSSDEPRTNLGGDEWANEWPKESAWDFVALGKGHDTAYWTEFLRALYEVDPDMLVNIEHEDTELGRVEGVAAAAEVLKAADAALRESSEA